MKRIKLTKPWGERKAGEVVEVDNERGARLVEDGFGMSEEDAILHGDPTAPPPAGVIHAGKRKRRG